MKPHTRRPSIVIIIHMWRLCDPQYPCNISRKSIYSSQCERHAFTETFILPVKKTSRFELDKPLLHHITVH